MNGTEIIELIRAAMQDNNLTVMQFLEGDDVEEDVWTNLQTLAGGYKIVDSDRPHPDEYQHVLQFPEHDVYIAFSGDYSSWSGADFSDSMPYEVVPATKTIKYWKAV